MPAGRRAPPLSPEDRRATIVAAALPLLRRHGTAVTTAQIARAARVAEGTLFRVFPDKAALICAAFESALDPGPAVAALRGIDRRKALRAQLIAAVGILQRRVEEVWQLISLLGMAVPLAKDPKRRGPSEQDAVIRAELTSLLQAHRDQLRCAPEQAANLLRMMTFAGTHPRITDNQPLAAEDIVAILLDGVLARDDLESL